MDDYYDLLGVEPGADTADIKNAYRDKKASLDAKGDKAETARVNKAWNVLSDPYQRGRYDAQRESAAETGELVSAAPAPAASDEAPPRRRGLFQPPGERPPPPKPTIEPPEGFTMAPQNKRLIAMAIDLVVLAIFVLGAQVLLPTLLENRYPDRVDLLDAMNQSDGDLEGPLAELREAQDDFDSAQDDLDELQDADDATEAELADAQDALDEAQTNLDEAETRAQPLVERCESEGYDTEVSRDSDDDDPVTLLDQLNECEADVTAGMQGFAILIIEASFILSFLYLLVPSAITGQTLGKRLRGVKVIRLDGSKLGWSGAFVRYGLIVGATNLLFFLGLSVLAPGIILLVVTGWMRNPNRMGMQDRFAKTLVVEA